MNNITKLFETLDSVQAESNTRAAEIRDRIQEQLTAVYEDWKELQDAVAKGENQDDVEYCTNEYVPDTSGEFAAEFNGYYNLVTVEWSRYTVACHHTSPCFVMADGSGPCGDLDTPGDSVIAYTLPPEFFRGEGE